MSQHDNPAAWETPLPGDDAQPEHKDYTGGWTNQEQQERFEAAWSDLKAEVLKNQKTIIKYSLYVAGASAAIMLVRGHKQKKEAAKLAKTFFDLRVTKDQVALLQAADINVLYDTPFGQLLLAAVPPAEG